MGNKGCHTCRCRSYEIEGNQPEEHDEVFMISVTKAIVDVHTVMIEFLHTFSTYHAMECPRRFYYLAIETEILQVYISIVT